MKLLNKEEKLIDNSLVITRRKGGWRVEEGKGG